MLACILKFWKSVSFIDKISYLKEFLISGSIVDRIPTFPLSSNVYGIVVLDNNIFSGSSLISNTFNSSSCFICNPLASVALKTMYTMV